MDARQRRLLFLIAGAVVLVVVVIAVWRATREDEVYLGPTPVSVASTSPEEVAPAYVKKGVVADAGVAAQLPQEVKAPPEVNTRTAVELPRTDAGQLQPMANAGSTVGSSGAAGSNGQSNTAVAAPDPAVVAQKDQIRKAINAVKPLIAECYRQALKTDPSLGGTVKLDFTIESFDGGGRMSVGEVPESELHSPFFEACVLEKVGHADFPPPDGNGTIKVRYPFHFDPGGGFGGN
ncbi:MAG: AgmX/PglI C-terminal domain-containing protein [Myxococcaceae bacterium]